MNKRDKRLPFVPFVLESIWSNVRSTRLSSTSTGITMPGVDSAGTRYLLATLRRRPLKLQKIPLKDLQKEIKRREQAAYKEEAARAQKTYRWAYRYNFNGPNTAHLFPVGGIFHFVSACGLRFLGYSGVSKRTQVKLCDRCSKVIRTKGGAISELED